MDRPRILVIDDEIGMCKTLQDILADQGYAVEVAYSGQEGLARAAARPPDLVILDQRLPDSDGLELLPRLREAAPKSKVLIATAYGRRQAAEREGVLAQLEKPLDVELALGIISKALNPSAASLEAELFATFGRRLRQLRRAQRLTQEALSRKTGLNQGYISDLERGKRNVSLRNLHRLAQALKTDLHQLFQFGPEEHSGD
ncbi:MAG: response regulator [Candidatus Acetothermia bacterium]|jgi:DNA-binding NtrC family response regulator|nr:response regulator [Candidatus Acetothermia bacterium]MDH7504855.1 response regulator [Candidatus Acetothermia bacterium]